MILERFPNLLLLSPSEKLVLATELWDAFDADREPEVDQEILAELNRRMEHFQANPTEVMTWESVKQRLLGSRE